MQFEFKNIGIPSGTWPPQFQPSQDPIQKEKNWYPCTSILIICMSIWRNLLTFLFKLQAVFNMSYLSEHEAIYHMNKIVLPLVKADVVSIEKSKGAGKKPSAGGKTAGKGKK